MSYISESSCSSSGTMSTRGSSSDSSGSNGNASDSSSSTTSPECGGDSSSSSAQSSSGEPGSQHATPRLHAEAAVATGDERSDSESGDRLRRVTAKPRKQAEQLRESRSEHLRRHSKESGQKGCHRCNFYKHQAYFEERCKWEHPSGGGGGGWVGWWVRQPGGL